MQNMEFWKQTKLSQNPEFTQMFYNLNQDLYLIYVETGGEYNLNRYDEIQWGTL